MKVTGIIPARYGSTRLPGKVLAKIGNKTLLQRVYENALQCGFNELVIAADHEKVLHHARHTLNAPTVFTSPEHRSGTERCAGAISKIEASFDVVVNIQADEPFLPVNSIKALLNAFNDPKVLIATLISKIEDPSELKSTDVVKVLKSKNNQALIFSRAVVPCLKNADTVDWTRQHQYYKHWGIYAYRRETLKKIVQLPTASLEKAESLEQLRWLENGYPVQVVETSGNPISIDTPQDLEQARRLVKKNNGSN